LNWTVTSGDTPVSTSTADTTVTISQNTVLQANAKDSGSPELVLNTTDIFKATSQRFT
jgi:hypothetical protein